jgi:hypothetical protein
MLNSVIMSSTKRDCGTEPNLFVCRDDFKQDRRQTPKIRVAHKIQTVHIAFAYCLLQGLDTVV